MYMQHSLTDSSARRCVCVYWTADSLTMPLSQGVFLWQFSQIGVKLYVHMMTEAFVYARIRLGRYKLTSVLICQEWKPDVVSWIETFFTRGFLGNCHVDTNEKYISFSTISPIPCKRLKRISWTENVNFVSPLPCKRLKKISWTKNVNFVWSKTGKLYTLQGWYPIVTHVDIHRHWHDSDRHTSLIACLWAPCIYINLTRNIFGSNCTESARLKTLLASHVDRRATDTEVI